MSEADRGADAGRGADPAVRVVVERMDGFPALMRRLEDGTAVLVGLDGEPLPTLRSGERLRVTRTIDGDATYAQPARVLHVADGASEIPIKAIGESTRSQQRDFARVETEPLHLAWTADDDTQGRGRLRDLSAGGLRVTDTAPHVGAHLRVVFELPGEGEELLPLELEGEVVWTDTVGDGVPVTGIQFLGLDAATEQQLTRWVFRQQARRTRGVR